MSSIPKLPGQLPDTPGNQPGCFCAVDHIGRMVAGVA